MTCPKCDGPMTSTGYWIKLVRPTDGSPPQATRSEMFRCLAPPLGCGHVYMTLPADVSVTKEIDP